MYNFKIRPDTDLWNKYGEIETDIQSGPVFFTKNGYGSSVMLSLSDYQLLVDPIERFLSETDRIAESDPRRFTADEVYSRLKEGVHARQRVHA